MTILSTFWPFLGNFGITGPYPGLDHFLDPSLYTRLHPDLDVDPNLNSDNPQSHLGMYWGSFAAPFRYNSPHLGVLGTLRGPIWVILGPLCGPIWVYLGAASPPHLGIIWRPLRGPIWVQFKTADSNNVRHWKTRKSHYLCSIFSFLAV